MYTYTTKVRFVPSILKQEVEVLKQAYLALDPTMQIRKSRDKSPKVSAVRSAFSRFNNLNKFYERLTMDMFPNEKLPDGSIIIDITAKADGNSARIYFKPSITSLTKEVRKAIIPLDDNNVFVYFDIKAAEFALRCIQADDQDALDTYLSGEDIYMHFAPLFPANTPRKTIKTILIANMYGQTPYTCSKLLGISEARAERLLNEVARNTPKLESLKHDILLYAKQHNGYFSTLGFDTRNLVKVADVDQSKGFNDNLAWSAYTQSALGLLMQLFTQHFLKHQQGKPGTFLSVFDSVVAEISKDSFQAYQAFVNKHFYPLLPDGMFLGSTMYQAMYEH